MSIKLDDLNGPLEKLSGGPTDGRYFAKVVRAEVCRSKQGNRQVRWDIELETPDDDSGYPLRKYHPIEAQYLRYLVNDLDKFNVRLPSMCDLPRTLKYLTGAKIEVDVHEDGEYYVVSFLRLVSTKD